MSHQELTRKLTDGHRNMERVLTLIRFQLDALETGEQDASSLRVLNNAMVYMHDYPGVNHHPVEEMIFGKLVGYAAEHGTVCAQLTGQHRSFGERETSLLQHIGKARSGNDMSRHHVRDLAIAYCADHSSHIRSEEVDVFPGAQRWLTPLDWQECNRHARETINPDVERHELKRYDNIYDRLMKEDAGAGEGHPSIRLVRASKD